MTDRVELHCGDALDVLRGLPAGSVQTCVTSPPYFALRAYLPDGHPSKALEVGAEPTPAEYVARLVAVFAEVRRVLRDDGTLWLNLGDSYNSSPVGRFNGGGFKDGSTGRDLSGVATSGAVDKLAASGLPPKNLLGIPWRVAFALQDDGWVLRQDLIWAKSNPMPESVRDRCTKAHEYLFLLSKNARYYFDAEAIREGDEVYHRKGTKGGHKLTQMDGYKGIAGGTLDRDPDEPYGFARDITTVGRNKRSVWTVTPYPYPGAHFAVMPPELVRPCVLAGTSERGCCPACGAPWVRVVERGEVPMTDRRRRLSATQREGHPAFEEKVRPSSLGAGSGGDVPGREVRTVGWQPSCACPPAEPVGCLVLDPFAGSGTTLAVAVEERRRAVGVELNPEYIQLIRRRLRGVTPALV